MKNIGEQLISMIHDILGYYVLAERLYQSALQDIKQVILQFKKYQNLYFYYSDYDDKTIK